MRVVRYYPRALEGDGGITGSVHRWSETCAALGIQVRVVYERSSTCRPAPDDEIDWQAVKHTGTRKFNAPDGLERQLADADVLVLHSAWTSHNIAAARAADRVGVPYVLEPRGAYDPHIVARRRAAKRLWWTALEQPLLERAAAIHVFFDAERAHLRALGYAGPIVVAANGVRAVERPLWDGGSSGSLLWLGRFDPEHKGLDLLLQALRLLPQRDRPLLRMHGPDWRGRKQAVREMASAMGLGGHVVVGDPVYSDDKYELMSRAACFVYPSRWEAFGNSVAEAAAVGTPVVGTHYPLVDYLAAHRGAISVEATPTALIDGLAQALDSDAGMIGQRGRQLVRSTLGWECAVRSWLTQVTSILGSPLTLPEPVAS